MLVALKKGDRSWRPRLAVHFTNPVGPGLGGNSCS